MERLTLLGVEADPLTMEDLHALIAEAVSGGQKWILANHNLHSIYLYARDAKLREFYARARVSHLDGMLLVLWARLLGCHVERAQRVTYADWVHPLMAESARNGWRVYYLGSKPGVAEKAAVLLRARYASLELCTRDGFFDVAGEDNRQVLKEMREFQPHVLMVGMGMPRQEHWILDNLEQISANAILCSGACFDYVAGALPTPPRWMGQVGLEWLYRLVSEPKRLWTRYLVEPWSLLGPAWRDLTRRRTK